MPVRGRSLSVQLCLAISGSQRPAVANAWQQTPGGTVGGTPTQLRSLALFGPCVHRCRIWLYRIKGGRFAPASAPGMRRWGAGPGARGPADPAVFVAAVGSMGGEGLRSAHAGRGWWLLGATREADHHGWVCRLPVPRPQAGGETGPLPRTPTPGGPREPSPDHPDPAPTATRRPRPLHPHPCRRHRQARPAPCPTSPPPRAGSRPARPVLMT
jgi:hypothetical protein